MGIQEGTHTIGGESDSGSDDPCDGATRVMIAATSWTDIQGHGAALNKLSTKFPASAVLMEVASDVGARGLRTVEECTSRDC